MATRFRRTATIAPGVKVNLNKASASMTVGTKGAHITKSTNGSVTKTAGIPGSGFSYVDRSGGSGSGSLASSPLFNPSYGMPLAPIKIVSGLNEDIAKKISYIIFDAPEIQFADFDKDCLAKLQISSVEHINTSTEVVTSKILKTERMAVRISLSYLTKKGFVKTIVFEPLDFDQMQLVLEAMREYTEADHA